MARFPHWPARVSVVQTPRGPRRGRGTAATLASSATAFPMSPGVSGRGSQELSAVRLALQHPQVRAPWTHGFAMLMRHSSRDLVQMVQIMRRPGGQQLR